MDIEITAEIVKRLKSLADDPPGSQRLGQIMAEVFTEGRRLTPERFVEVTGELSEMLARGVDWKGRRLEDWPIGPNFPPVRFEYHIQRIAKDALELSEGFMGEVYKIRQANSGPESD